MKNIFKHCNLCNLFFFSFSNERLGVLLESFVKDFGFCGRRWASSYHYCNAARKSTSLLRDIGDIKVKAILEYHEGMLMSEIMLNKISYNSFTLDNYRGLVKKNQTFKCAMKFVFSEKGLHIERQKQFGMKYQQMKFQAKCQEKDIPEVVNDIFEANKVKKPYLVIQLLEKGVNPNVRNEKQQTPLHLASENKLERVVEKLISHGAEKML